MAPHYAILGGRVCYSKASVDHHNYYGHDRTSSGRVVSLLQRKESHAIPAQEPRAEPSGKEPILLEQKNPDDGPDLDTMDGAAHTSLLASGEFEPVADFDGASRVLEFDPTIDMIINPTPTPVAVA
ncbi:uncharacterized protein A4U43_C04F25670 [Asparagus officinalis]|uniref:Uncharacterized protein n=1 Tax=Asparagus officinalis TaxID=4686 RepID=A0A5P1F8A4_ASPOF|nr:uncharacterized protein A4U43_C04F25670 [Asparagus officinalis]